MGRWLHAVTLAVVVFGTVTCAQKLERGPKFKDVTIEQLLAKPPLGERVRVQCDANSALGFVEKKPAFSSKDEQATLDQIVGLCELGDYVLPVIVKQGQTLSRLPIGTVDLIGEQIWMRQGISGHKEISRRLIGSGLFLDARPERDLVTIIGLGTCVLLDAWWLYALWRRWRDREQADA